MLQLLTRHQANHPLILQINDKSSVNVKANCKHPTNRLSCCCCTTCNNFDFAKQLTQPTHPIGISSAAAAPHTPKRQWTELGLDESPPTLPPPSPSDIPRFLKYAKDNLGIMDAAHNVDGLRDKHLGPMPLIRLTIRELTGVHIAMPYGDALCWDSDQKRQSELRLDK